MEIFFRVQLDNVEMPNVVEEAPVISRLMSSMIAMKIPGLLDWD
jgi:hypothetical protein